MVVKYGVFDIITLEKEINDALSSPGGTISEEHLRFLIASKGLMLDDVDFALLTVTEWFLNNDRFPDEIILRFAPAAFAYLDDEKELSLFAADARVALSKLGEKLLKEYVPSVRAKLAALELLGKLPGRPTVPLLVSVSRKYLACDVVQDWIDYYRHRLQFGSKTEKAKAKKLLDQLFAAIRGDARKNQKSQYPHWEIVCRYKVSLTCLDAARAVLKTKTYPLGAVEKWLLDNDLPPDFAPRLADLNGTSPAELAIEDLISKGLVPEAISFRKIQTKLNPLFSRIERLGILDLFLFLDIPARYPHLVNGQVDEVIEKIDVNSGFFKYPRHNSPPKSINRG